MQPFRLPLLAAFTAAVLALPVASADAHRHHRWHGGDAAGAFALGIISGAVIGQALAPRAQYRAPYGYCYDPYGRTYLCDDWRAYGDGPHYRMVPRADPYFRHHDRIMSEHEYYERQRQDQR